MIILHLSGGLGNQMFQYAFGRTTARRLGVELAVNLSDPTLKIHNGFELDSVFQIEVKIAARSDVQAILGWGHHKITRKVLQQLALRKLLLPRYVEEPYFQFTPQIMHTSDNVYLDGYWQSERYFADAIESVRSWFTFRTPASGLNEALASDIVGSNGPSISLHVRRGDYVTNPTVSREHGLSSLEYYQAAIQYLVKGVQNPQFYVFSDDMDWVRNTLSLPYPHVFVEHNRGKSSYEDMRLMSLCRHHIIANSSFSWWGAWLNANPDKIVVAPKKWLISVDNVKDLFPEGWMML